MIIAFLATFVCFAIGTAACSYAAFRQGYNLGWDERHKDMILPRNVVARHAEQERRSATPEQESE